MIGYITIGAIDIDRAKIFYDSGQTIWICKPFDGETARAGNGIMVGFDAETKDQVHRFYDAAMKAGGRDEGGPGPRPDYGPNWYAAYLRDPTGNKLAIVCRKPA